MEEQIAIIIDSEMKQGKALVNHLHNIIISEEVQQLKADAPVTFCELLAIYEEEKRHYEMMCTIAEAFKLSYQPHKKETIKSEQKHKLV